MEVCSLIVAVCLLAQAEAANGSKSRPARSAKSRAAAPAEAFDELLRSTHTSVATTT